MMTIAKARPKTKVEEDISVSISKVCITTMGIAICAIGVWAFATMVAGVMAMGGVNGLIMAGVTAIVGQ